MKKKIRVLHVLPSCSRQAGGLFYSVKGLASALAKLGIDIFVICGEDDFSEEDILTWPENVRPILTKKYRPYSFSFMPNLISEIERVDPDIIHVHGVWSFHAWAAVKWAEKNTLRRLVVSPRGMFDEHAMQLSRVKKAVARFFYVDKLNHRCDLFHALNLSESLSIRKLVSEHALITAIPNGVDSFNIKKKLALKPGAIDGISIVFLGRIHPKKGLEDFLLALPQVVAVRSVFVSIAGWGQEKYINGLKKLVIELGVSDYVEFCGSKYGADKLDFLNNAQIFVLPSYSEGLPMAVLEAWQAGVYTLISRECNFGNLEDLSFALEIDHDPNNIALNLIRAVDNITNNNAQALSIDAQRHVLHNFSWDNIAAKLNEQYLQILGDLHNER